jgi:hypothetical protein
MDWPITSSGRSSRRLNRKQGFPMSQLLAALLELFRQPLAPPRVNVRSHQIERKIILLRRECSVG